MVCIVGKSRRREKLGPSPTIFALKAQSERLRDMGKSSQTNIRRLAKNYNMMICPQAITA
jgi:hypothetical protein